MYKNLLLLLFILTSYVAQADSGIFQSYVILDLDGGGNAYYHGGFNSDNNNNPIQAAQITPASTLILNGAELKTYKNNGSDVTGGSLLYRLYKEGDTPGSFTSINLPYDSELGNGDQKWAETAAGIDLLSGIVLNGTYKLEVYWEAYSSDGTHFDSNFGNNFIADIIITYLPVELYGFRADHINEEVQISWKTASELNNEKFLVQKSDNGINFETIGKVDGYGTTSDTKYYSFIDDNIRSVTQYYRLKQMDFDGKYSVSKVIQISLNSVIEINVYPNPVLENFTIESSNSIISKAEIYNLKGELLLSKSFNKVGKQKLNMPSDFNGRFILIIYDNNGLIIESIKMIK